MQLKSVRQAMILALAACFAPLFILVFFTVLPFQVLYLLSRRATQKLYFQGLSKQPRTILITGVHTPIGLHVSRALSDAGHQVVGCDLHISILPGLARWSRAVSKLRPVRAPTESYGSWLFVKDICRIARQEGAEVWLDYSELLSLDDCIQAQSALADVGCFSLFPSRNIASSLASRHSYLDWLRTLKLSTPEYHQVKSRGQVHNLLNDSRGRKKYKLDDGTSMTSANSKAVLLPQRTLSQTYGQVSKLQISRERPWILEQEFDGAHEITAYAVIHQGRLKAFAAVRAEESVTSLQTVPIKSALGQAAIRHVQLFCTRAGEDLSCQLSITFRIIEEVTDTGFENRILPISCSTQSHPAAQVVSTSDFASIAESLLSSSSSRANGVPQTMNQERHVQEVYSPTAIAHGVYCFPTDLLDLVLRPLLLFLTLRMNLGDLFRSNAMFARHLLYCRESLFEFSDPLPAIWGYLIEKPLSFSVELARHKS